MLEIYLARHGQDQDNVNGILNGRRDMELTEKGREQARELAENIYSKKINFDKVYTSPLKRAIETAKIITNRLKISDPEILDTLIERDFGIMTGKSHTEIEKLCSPNVLKTNTVTYFLSPEGAETFPELYKRGKHVIDFISSHHPSGKILLVCHGDIGKMIYASYYNSRWEDVLQNFHFGNSDLLLMSENSHFNDSHCVTITQMNL